MTDVVLFDDIHAQPPHNRKKLSPIITANMAFIFMKTHIQIPLGVEFAIPIATASGWTITSSADLGVLFTMGNTDIKSRAAIYGSNNYTDRSTVNDVNDSVAFTGTLGIKAAADNGSVPGAWITAYWPAATRPTTSSKAGKKAAGKNPRSLNFIGE